ncbi:MAG: hypothetical protein M3P32_06025 [Chloroflexota bacterium]|nr:hypothetical protein [Chloroflexota bacterium]
MSDEHDHHGHEDHDDHEGHHHGHEPVALDPQEHRAEAVALFNGVWQMLDAADRTAAQDDQMVHAAHASRWHWSQAAELGGDEQLAVGEWQCSRVYSVLRRGEPALHHARACLAICENPGLSGWVVAAAYEALARASVVAGDIGEARAWLGRAQTAVATIADPDDREVIEADLASLAALPGFAAG